MSKKNSIPFDYIKINPFALCRWNINFAHKNYQNFRSKYIFSKIDGKLTFQYGQTWRMIVEQKDLTPDTVSHSLSLKKKLKFLYISIKSVPLSQLMINTKHEATSI